MYNHSFEYEKYKNLSAPPRTYVNKYFGNDRGISLQSDVEQGYIEDLSSLMPVFNKPNVPKEEIKEDFMANVEGNKQTQQYLSKHAKSWPHKYYKNKKGLSLEKIRENYNNYNKRAFRDGYKIIKKSGPIRSGPFKHNSNKYGHSLKSITQAGGGMAGLAFSN